MTGKKKSQVDMLNGPLLKNVILFALPLAASGILQLLFNAADTAVVGRYNGSQALAAVGSTATIINLLVTLCMGLSIGANVLAAQFSGAGNKKELHATVQTAILTASVLGILLVIIGYFATDPLLHATGSPEDVFPLAHLYLRIYFLGMPANMIYNFGAAILRAVGDTKKPLYFLSFAGLMNVLLNLLFVIVLHMSVAGVAIATVASQVISAVLVLYSLIKTREAHHFNPRELRFDGSKLKRMVQVGIPAGIQGASFSISNLLIQSSINSFGSTVMAASTLANSMDGMCYVALDAIAQAAISFAGQNYGAGNYKRLDSILKTCLGLGCSIGIVTGTFMYLNGHTILHIFSTDEQAIDTAVSIMRIVCLFQFINCTMNVPFNVIRGTGHSFYPMISAILCVCVLRVVWIFSIFRAFRTLFVLYLSYPVTKGLASITGIAYYMHLRKTWNKQTH